jgi:hypothetical protein
MHGSIVNMQIPEFGDMFDYLFTAGHWKAMIARYASESDMFRSTNHL